MAKRRLEKTFADYIAIAISPLLIMFLVGSLVFFLLEIGYDGQYDSRLRWIMFWFVVASVLVGRISIEQGSGYARVYGLCLALAVSFVIFRFVDSFVFGALCLLGVVWWCTDKLTWDCTLIDDAQDASGEGLLQAAGIADEPGSNSSSDDEHAPELNASQTQGDSADETAEYESATGRTPFWKTSSLQNQDEPPKQPHAPGLWVMYFSLAALPLFGLGQLFIPASDVDAREYAFRLLWIYVAAALGLLLTTSFLGLRRYLRQRKVKMPASIAGLWVGMGAALILAILLLCVLLPRPQADYSLTAMIDKVSSKIGKASRIAFLNDDAGEGKGQRTGDSEKGAGDSKDKESAGDSSKKGSKKAGSGNAKGKGSKSGQSSESGKKGGKGSKTGKGTGKKNGKQGSSGKDNNSKDGKGSQKSSDEKNKGKKSNQQIANNKKNQQQKENDGQKNQDNSQQQASSSPQSPSSNPSGTLEKIFKWIMYALLALVVLYYAIKHWSSLVETLKLFWQELVNFWHDLFNRKPKDEKSHVAENFETETLVPRRPFAAFSNPFSSGAAQQMQPEELVRYTFEALEAWAFEQHVERKQDQTPLEFARLVGDKISMVSKEVRQVAKLYVQVAYADFSPKMGSLRPLEILWRRLGA